MTLTLKVKSITKKYTPVIILIFKYILEHGVINTWLMGGLHTYYRWVYEIITLYHMAV